MTKKFNRNANKARRRAHDYFDLLWKSGLLTRSNAYKNLRVWMNLPNSSRAHIQQFNQQQCQMLIDIVKEKFPELYQSEELSDKVS